MINLAPIGAASCKGAEVMESTAFCGTTCDTVKAPQNTAHQRGDHAGVKCVACHIRPGGTWFVRAKLSGARQVVETALGTYSPDEEGSPAQDTVLLVHVGGKRGESSQGIHWHADPAVRIRYRSDPKGETIDIVEVTRPDGRVETYKSKTPPESPATGSGGEWRGMDWCHAGDHGTGEGVAIASNCDSCHSEEAPPT